MRLIKTCDVYRFPNKRDRKKWRVGDVAEDIILKSVSESTRLGGTETIQELVGTRLTSNTLSRFILCAFKDQPQSRVLH